MLLGRPHRCELPCFVCALLDGDPDYQHHIIHQDPDTIAFLNRYPTLPGHCLIAPRQHIQDWVHDMDTAHFLRIQALTHTIARAIAATVPTERMYSLSLGSMQATPTCTGTSRRYPHTSPATSSNSMP